MENGSERSEWVKVAARTVIEIDYGSNKCTWCSTTRRNAKINGKYRYGAYVQSTESYQPSLP